MDRLLKDQVWVIFERATRATILPHYQMDTATTASAKFALQ
jgi:hypothetical protein